jgi:hypothetical protein
MNPNSVKMSVQNTLEILTLKSEKNGINFMNIEKDGIDLLNNVEDSLSKIALSAH